MLDSSVRGQAEFDRTFSRQSDPWSYDYDDLEKVRRDAEVRLLDRVRGGERFSRAVEIGCAEGRFTEYLSQRCDKLLALDISPVALVRAKSRLADRANVSFQQADIRTHIFNGKYDLITAVHVFEYIRNPLAIRRIRERLIDALRPGGRLLIGTTCDGAVSEHAWWGRYLLRGGNWTSAFISGHPCLQLIERSELPLRGCISLDVLCRKKR